MRTINEIFTAEYLPIADLETYRPLPSQALTHLDPFLLLNHHGPQKYPPHNNGLPFGPHPHRGIETVTFVMKGDIMHKDSTGSESIVNSGGIQWMTAGKGLIHEEQVSSSFREKGGDIEVLQLWLNLPSKLKMVPPRYIALQKEQIPVIDFNDGNVSVRLISGTLLNHNGPVSPATGVYLSIITFKPGGKVELQAPYEHNILFYIVSGQLKANNTLAHKLQLIEFQQDAENIQVEAAEASCLIFGHGKPFNEPIVAKGPFVMNSEEEIRQAYKDFRDGTLK